MTMNNRNDKNLDDVIYAAVSGKNPTFNFDQWKQQHQSQIAQYQSEIRIEQAKVSHQPVIAGKALLQSRFTKIVLAAAAVLIFALVLGRDGQSIAWGQIVEKFRSVPFFSAAIYVKEDAVSEPRQMELWMSQDGRARMRVGTQIIFAQNGRPTKVFDIKSRQQTQPDEQAVMFLSKVAEANEFSLEAIINTMFGGKAQDVTPLVNPSAVISQDIVVFDVELPRTTEWVRIWALRESKLPVRIRVWDPRDGESADAVFDYSREQSQEFFDPNAFEQILHDNRNSSQVNIAYAGLKDPGGKKMSPEQMFAETGYHIPQVTQIGITPDGAVWIVADKGQNRRPDGGMFFGFGKLQDDMDRRYVRVYASHETATDRSIEVYAPVDYPFDANVPGKLILTCEVEDYNPHTKPQVIGTLEFTQWQQGQTWPSGTVKGDDEQSFRMRMAWHHCYEKAYDKAERILATIPGEPEDNPAALERERIHLRMLLQEDELEDALTLGERLIPILEKSYRSRQERAMYPSIFSDYIVTLARAGKIDQVKQTWRHIRQIEPVLPANLSENSRSRISRSIEVAFDAMLRVLVTDLSHKAHLTVDQISSVLDVDVKKDERFKGYYFWDWNPEYEKPKYRDWAKHLADLAEYYKTHLLPEKMEIIERDNKEYGTNLFKMPGIDSHHVYPLQGRLFDYVRVHNLEQTAGRIRIEADISDVQLHHDLIYKTGTTESEQRLFVLDYFGLELREVNEPRRVWIAHHDGRKLKPYKEVRAPLAYDGSGQLKPGMMCMSSGGGFDLAQLFMCFNQDQNAEAKANGIIIVDQTGIKDKVSIEEPAWPGPKSIELARKWFSDEFGITFTEQTRTMATYVFRPKSTR